MNRFFLVFKYYLHIYIFAPHFFLWILIDSTPMDDGTALMKPISKIQDGDTIGIAIQQDDLPMIQFLLNGEPLHDIAINRFRGMVYPSVFIQSDDGDDSGENDVSVTFVWKEDEFKEMSPSVRFKPLMAAIGII